MNSPSSSSSTSPPVATKSLLESITAAKATNGTHSLDAFLARAELAKVTRALRARLSYASYKAANNLTHVPLHTLEQQQAQNAPRSQSVERNASGEGFSGGPSAQSPRRRQPPNQMMPPPSAPSLYSALLSKDSQSSSAPGPSSSSAHKRARHSSPASHVAMSPKSKGKASSSARAAEPSPRSARKKKKIRASSPGSRSTTSTRSTTRGDIDMYDGGGSTTELEDMDFSAAAALTSLLHDTSANTANNSSGSGASVPHSPTPSHASSFTEVGASTASGSGIHRRDATHLSVPGGGMGSINGLLSPRGSMSMSMPPSQERTTPNPASDADAAEMMLYLATSPSPARPTTVRRIEGPLGRSTGRVLFPSSGNSMSTFDDAGAGHSQPHSPMRGGVVPNRSITQSLTASDRPRMESPRSPPGVSGGGGTYGHARTHTAPESIYAGELLPAPMSPSGTVYGDSQGQPDSQSTAVGAWDDEEGPLTASQGSVSAKGKGRSVELPSTLKGSSATRISSPMSVDEPEGEESGAGSQGTGYYGGFGGYLHPGTVPPAHQPPGIYDKSLRSPPPFMAYSDVRGGRQDSVVGPASAPSPRA